MANHRRLPDPTYTPPNEHETSLGYWFVCPGCDRRWAQRYQDRRTLHCLPCAREWRRDDMMSRRKGLGGVELTKNPPSHPFESAVLGREVNLNSPDAHHLIQTNPRFAAEVDAYINKLVAKNTGGRSPLRGVLPILPRRAAAPAYNAVVVDDEPKEAIDVEAQEVVDRAMRGS
jgi:hypothetical protein